jgi:hypothetical protein
MVSNGAGLTELTTCDVELMEEQSDPSNKHLLKSQWIIEREQRCSRLDARVTEADSNANNF